jgi:DNA-binding HxlR family transcriptional regulator
MSENPIGDLRSTCPLAAGLDIFGDKWTLLVVRDMLLHDRHRYNQLLAADEGIPTNILAERLKRLESRGIVRKQIYQRHPQRFEYHLTDKGRELEPVVRAIIAWGLKHVPGTGKDSAQQSA